MQSGNTHFFFLSVQSQRVFKFDHAHSEDDIHLCILKYRLFLSLRIIQQTALIETNTGAGNINVSSKAGLDGAGGEEPPITTSVREMDSNTAQACIFLSLRMYLRQSA